MSGLALTVKEDIARKSGRFAARTAQRPGIEERIVEALAVASKDGLVKRPLISQIWQLLI